MKDRILFYPPFARLKARAFYALVGFQYDGFRGMRCYWRRFAMPDDAETRRRRIIFQLVAGAIVCALALFVAIINVLP